jgi:CheY-like chemotaxis protein
VADQLGLSVRHLKREQHKAIEILAEVLRERNNLRFELSSEPEHEAGSGEAEGDAGADAGDLQWLDGASASKPVDLALALPAVMTLVRSIADRYHVHLEMAAGQGLPSLAVHPVALRQALLSLLYVAIRRVPGGTVTVSVRASGWDVEICISSTDGEPQPVAPEDEANLAVAHHLASSSGGSLILAGPEEPFAATLTLPAAEQKVILVIDDNLDAIRLFQRYASGTHYNVLGTQDPEQAFVLACKHSPHVIMLDVMMPQIDGWEFLGRLKQHPLTSAIPVVACTILAQEELAFSLGVDAFLHKPVSRQAFLETLDHLASLAP